MKYHIVQVNEKAQDISKKYNVSIEEIVKLNRHINHIDSIVPGMKIRLPILSDEVSDELKDNFLDIEKYYPKVEDFKEVKVEKKIEDEKEKEIVEIQDENETEEEKSEAQQQPNYNQSQYPYAQQYYQPYYNIPQYYQPQHNYNPYYQPNYQIYQQPLYLREQNHNVSVKPIKQPDLTLPYLKDENLKVDNRVLEQPALSDRILIEGFGKIEKQSDNSPKYFQDPLYTPPYPCHKSIVDDDSECVCKEDGFDENVKEIRIDLRDLVKKHTKVNKKKDPLDLLK